MATHERTSSLGPWLPTLGPVPHFSTWPMAAPHGTARHTRRNTPVDSFGSAPGLTLHLLLPHGIIRPRRLPLLHTATVTAALASTTVTVASVADVSLAPFAGILPPRH